MRKIIIITIIILISNIGYSQIYLDQIEGSDTLNKIAITTTRVIYGSDTTYLQSYGSLEIRNDSLCIVNGNCLLDISVVNSNISNSELTQTESIRTYNGNDGDLKFSMGKRFQFSFGDTLTNEPFSIDYVDDGKLLTNFGNSNHYLLRSQLELESGSDNTNRVGSLVGQTVINNSTHSDVVGFYGNVKNESGTVTNQRAGYLANVTNGTGSVDNSTGLDIQVTNTGTDTITEGVGVNVATVATGQMTKFTAFKFNPISGSGVTNALAFTNDEPNATSYTKGGFVLGSTSGLMGNYRLVVDANGSNDPVRIYDIQDDASINKIWGSSTDGILKSIDKYTLLDTVSVLATQYGLDNITETDPIFTAWNYEYDSLINAPVLIDNDTINEGQMDFVDLGGGTFRYGSNTFDSDYLIFDNGFNSANATWSKTGNILGLDVTETDPIYSAWDKDYNDLTNLPTLADLNYWTLSGSDLYRTSKVAVNTTTLSTYADLIIGGKHIDFASTSNSSFIGRQAGSTNTQTNQMGIGYQALQNATGGTSTGIGYQAGKNNTGASLMAIGHIVAPNNTGINNTFIGYLSAFNNTSGGLNLFMGASSGYANTTGERNVMLGYNVGQLAGVDSDRCVYIGYESGQISGGDFNTGVGTASLKNSTSIFNAGFGYGALSTTTGGYNTGLGAWSGGLATGANNVFIGYQAGYNSTGSNELYIDNSSTASPLIYGNFTTNAITINGTHEVTGNATITGNLTLTDNLEGNAVNIGGYDSSNKLTRVSIGSGLSLTSGTLSNSSPNTDAQTLSISGSDLTISSGNTVDLDLLTQHVGRATMTEAVTSTAFQVIAVTGPDFDNGAVSVNDASERIDITLDGYYQITFNGWVEWGTGGEAEIRLKKNGTGDTEYIQQVTLNDDDTEGVHMTDIIYLSDGDNVQLEGRKTNTVTGNCDIYGYFSVLRI